MAVAAAGEVRAWPRPTSRPTPLGPAGAAQWPPPRDVRAPAAAEGAGPPGDARGEEDDLTSLVFDLLSGVEEQQSRTNDKTSLEFRGQWHPKPRGAETGHGVVPKEWALATASENDRALSTFGWAGGAALCLSNAFGEADQMEAQASDLVDQGLSEDHLQVQCIRALARASEEREAVMRKQWSDIDFQEGEEKNQELLSHLERDFAGQLASVAARQARDLEDELGAHGGSSPSSPARRRWYTIKASGGTASGRTYLSANLVRQDGVDLCLTGYDDGSGRQRWFVEADGQHGFRLRVVGGTGTDRRVLGVSSSGSLELRDVDDGSGRQRWRIASPGAAEPWCYVQPSCSDMYLSADSSGALAVRAGDGRMERWLIPGWQRETRDDAPGRAAGGGAGPDEVVAIAARSGGSSVAALSGLSAEQLSRVLNDNRALGAALDLVGCYLKNYDIDKADRVCRRVAPLCRERGGLWLFKLLNMYSTVRMKQSRFQEALEMYEEFESLIGHEAEAQWELYDTVYRNFGWIHCSLGNHEKAMDFFRRCVEIKKKNGVPPHWFDQWDLGKTHARLSVQRGNFEALRHSIELIKKGIDLHQQVEQQDKVMLCKMLNSAGECAQVLGDFGPREEARAWFEEAVRLHRQSYALYVSTLGAGKPLTGWCMEQLAGALRKLRTAEGQEEAKQLLHGALRVECAKDIIKLPAMERLLSWIIEVHRETGDFEGLQDCQDAINVGLDNLRRRGVAAVEAGSYAALLLRIVELLSTHSRDQNLECMVQLLEEASRYAQEAAHSKVGCRGAAGAEAAGAGAWLGEDPEARRGLSSMPMAGGQEMEELDIARLVAESALQLRRCRDRLAERSGGLWATAAGGAAAATEEPAAARAATDAATAEGVSPPVVAPCSTADGAAPLGEIWERVDDDEYELVT